MTELWNLSRKVVPGYFMRNVVGFPEDPKEGVFRIEDDAWDAWDAPMHTPAFSLAIEEGMIDVPIIEKK